MCIETARQVKGSIVRARITTGTYTLQSNRHTLNKKIVDPTCPLCQLEEEDLRHMVCWCPAFFDYGVLVMKQLKVIQVSNLSVWDCYLINCLNILKIFVCPDFIHRVVPELSTSISKIEVISRVFFYKIRVRKLQMQKGEWWLPSPTCFFFS